MFLKRFQKTINKCFRKIRNKEIVDIEKEDLFDKWKELKKKYDNKSKAELEKVEEELAEKYVEKYYEKIKQTMEGIDCEDGCLSSGKL